MESTEINESVVLAYTRRSMRAGSASDHSGAGPPVTAKHTWLLARLLCTWFSIPARHHHDGTAIVETGALFVARSKLRARTNQSTTRVDFARDNVDAYTFL